jgi:peptidoglycan/xylan/chitin deacetylase (PgdA/CDA1 family)
MLDAVKGDRRVRITFDDGNASDLECALPALVDRGLKGEFFLVVENIGAPGYLTIAQVRELAATGMEIGLHGVDHSPWQGLDNKALDLEIVGGRRRLEDILQRPVDTAACPFGTYDRRCLRVLRSAGFRKVYTCDGGTARPREWLQSRTTVRKSHNVDDVMSWIGTSPWQPREVLRRAKTLAKRLL